MTQSNVLSIVLFIISFFVIHCQETKVDIRIQREHTQPNFPAVIGVCSMSTTTTTTVTSTQTTSQTTTSTTSQTTTQTTTSTSTQTTTSTSTQTTSATSTPTTTTKTTTTTTTTTTVTTTTIPFFADTLCGFAWTGGGGWLGDRLLGRNVQNPKAGYTYYTDMIYRKQCTVSNYLFDGGSGIRTPNFYPHKLVGCDGDYKCTFVNPIPWLTKDETGYRWCYKPNLAGYGNTGSYKIYNGINPNPLPNQDNYPSNPCDIGRKNWYDGCYCWDAQIWDPQCHGTKWDFYTMYCELNEFTPSDPNNFNPGIGPVIPNRRRSTEQTCEELGGQEHYLETIITSGTLSMTLDDFYFLKTSYGFIGNDKKIINNYITAQTCMDKNCLFEPTSFTTTNAWFSLGPMKSFFLTNITNLQTIFIPFNPQALSIFQATSTADVCLRIQTNLEINIHQIDSYIPNRIPKSEILNSGKFQFSYSFKKNVDVYNSLFSRQGLSLVIDVTIADLFLQIHPQGAYLNGYNLVTCS